MSGNKVLDVREIDKRFRKKIILNNFDDLLDEQQLELISNHSLAPLNKLFFKERHGFFSWSDLVSGPELWKIAIRKTEVLNLTIIDIIKQFPLAIDILEEQGIPYYKSGNQKLIDINKDARSIYEEIKHSKQLLVNPLRTDRWSISFTIDYIINNHHTYVKEMIPELGSLIDHLVEAHSSTHPQLPMIREKYSEFKGELIDHMNDEENIVFPSYKKLEKALFENKVEEVIDFDDAISWMEEDHILTGATLKSMRNFCNNYVAPKESSPGFKILYEELKKFEYDLHFHMYLENNVLFTKVVTALNKLGANS
jgi:regulator of cell morphogenesis and NO signaling